ncbi:MAG: hypothetical protein ABI923_01340 [bacterium]
MINLDTLDTIIAMVVVLLVLSLIVQSIQSFIKKMLKVKSGTILNSLEDLFSYIDTTGTGKTPKQLVEEVKAELKKIGRVSFRGTLMIDSIAKGDLEKILNKLGYNNLISDMNVWFDSVMQSFEERYSRHMKTIALIISILVVIFLNANFFNVYQKIASDSVTRAALLEKGEALKKKREQQTAANVPESDPANVKLKEEYEQLQKEYREGLGTYKGFGFNPLTLQQTKDFVNARGGWENQSRFKEGTKVLAGWALMALLLSVGAPFWQDTLESLFGLKNLLRKRSDTRNVEEEKGGQPKP